MFRVFKSETAQLPQALQDVFVDYSSVAVYSPERSDAVLVIEDAVRVRDLIFSVNVEVYIYLYFKQKVAGSNRVCLENGNLFVVNVRSAQAFWKSMVGIFHETKLTASFV